MTQDDYDDFLQDVTLEIREMWEDAGGSKIGEFQAQALNDLLDDFFRYGLIKEQD